MHGCLGKGTQHEHVYMPFPAHRCNVWRSYEAGFTPWNRNATSVRAPVARPRHVLHLQCLILSRRAHGSRDGRAGHELSEIHCNMGWGW